MQQIIEKLLRESISDRQLDKEETVQLRELASTLTREPKLKAFTRNRAFVLVRETSENGTVCLEHFSWLEKVLKVLDTHASAHIPKTSVGFSPGTNCRDMILRELTTCRTSLDICVFTISDNILADAILAAHQRGVSVRVLTDQHKSLDKGSDVLDLQLSGVNVVLDTSQWHMHHKFAIFDQVRLLNGSFNWTLSATQRNQENVLVTDNPDVVQPYVKEFEKLWQQHNDNQTVIVGR